MRIAHCATSWYATKDNRSEKKRFYCILSKWFISSEIRKIILPVRPRHSHTYHTDNWYLFDHNRRLLSLHFFLFSAFCFLVYFNCRYFYCQHACALNFSSLRVFFFSIFFLLLSLLFHAFWCRIFNNFAVVCDVRYENVLYVVKSVLGFFGTYVIFVLFVCLSISM